MGAIAPKIQCAGLISVYVTYETTSVPKVVMVQNLANVEPFSIE